MISQTTDCATQGIHLRNALPVIDGIVDSLTSDVTRRRCPRVDRAQIAATLFPEYAALLGFYRDASGRWKNDGPSWFDALYLARAILEVLNDSIPKVGLFPLEDQLSFFNRARLWPKEKFIPFAKYVTAWPMARYLHNELPAKPSGFVDHPFVFTGRIRKLLKARVVSENPKCAMLFNSYLQGVKRGTAPASEDFVYSAFEKHKASLSKPPSNDDPRVTHLTYIERALGGFRFRKPKLYEASTSAAWENPIASGGAREYLRETHSRGSGHLLKMVETRPGVVVSIHGSEFPTKHGELVEEASMIPSPYHVRVAPVLEPIKVRLVSKGVALPYYLAKTAQRDMWQYLQEFPQFGLTGRTIDPSDLCGVLDRERLVNAKIKAQLGEEVEEWSPRLWVSGDYAAATDGLDIRMTMSIMEAMLVRSDYSEEFKDILRGVIGPQVISYPKVEGKPKIEPFLQQNGQLMGSPLSFPILCLINLIAYWKTLEEELGIRLNLSDLPVLVNGDDILFRTTPSMYERWKTNIQSVGFALSLGKNYVHPTYVMINSQLYRWKEDGSRYGTFTPIHFLNCGLLMGNSKVRQKASSTMKTSAVPIWAAYNDTVPKAALPERAHRRFIHYNRKVIEHLSSYGLYNIFSHSNRGGFGCVIPRGLQPRFTGFQRRFAYFLEREFKAAISKDEEPRKTLALVRDGSSGPAFPLPRTRRIVAGPIIGPLEYGQEEFMSREIKLPNLAFPIVNEDLTMRVRKPSKSLREQFRVEFYANRTYRLKINEMISWPWRLAVQQSKPEDQNSMLHVVRDGVLDIKEPKTVD